MLVDKPAARETTSPAEASQPQTRARVRFRKEGDLRFLGHHDLMNCLERMFRRAQLTLMATHGFNPRPRMTFALSLALGIVGKREVMEVELADSLSVDDIKARLEAHAPAGLHIIEIRLLGPRDKARVSQAVYRVEIPEERRGELAQAIETVLASPHCWVERRRPQPRRCDVRAFVHDLRLDGQALELVFHVSPEGTARPEEILRLLGLGDLVDAGVIVERTDLLLVDEGAPDCARAQPAPAVHRQPANSQNNSVIGRSTTEPSGPGSILEVEPPHRPTPLLPGPLSFDS